MYVRVRVRAGVGVGVCLSVSVPFCDEHKLKRQLVLRRSYRFYYFLLVSMIPKEALEITGLRGRLWNILWVSTN